MIAAYIVIYIIGLVSTLLFLINFGKKIGVAKYDPPHEGWYDDWDSNAQAYVGWSIAWPMIWLVGSSVLIWKGLIFATQKLIRKEDNYEINNQK